MLFAAILVWIQVPSGAQQKADLIGSAFCWVNILSNFLVLVKTPIASEDIISKSLMLLK